MQYDNTRNDCILDLNITYGKFASIRLSKIINEREQELDSKMTMEEILKEYRLINEELCRTCLTRLSK